MSISFFVMQQVKETNQQMKKVRKSQQMMENVLVKELTAAEQQDVWDDVMKNLPPVSDVDSDTEPTVTVNVLPANSNVPKQMILETQEQVSTRSVKCTRVP